MPLPLLIAFLCVLGAAFLPTFALLGREIDDDFVNWMIRRRSERRLTRPQRIKRRLF